MATGNFYENGNHGLNVIASDDDTDDFLVGDTIANIVEELKNYSVDHITIKTPRSFDIGQAFAVFNNKNKVVAILEVCAGYYSGANMNIYTNKYLLDEYERDECTYDKRDIKKVVEVVKRNTRQYSTVARFSNGEMIYKEIKE